MKIQNFILVGLLIFTISGCSSKDININNNQSNKHKTEKLYNSFINDDQVKKSFLTQFLYKMPKGGDLHHHYSGSLYVETYLAWLKKANQCIDAKTLKVANCDDKYKSTLKIDELYKRKALYRKLLTLWSDKDYGNFYHEQLAPDQSFFNTFGYFGKASILSYVDGLSILKKRAINENISYIETMLSGVPYDYNVTEEIDSFNSKILEANNDEKILILIDNLAKKIESEKLFKDKVNTYLTKLNSYHKDAKIDDGNFTMRYQTYASRGSIPSKVFSALLAGFEAANRSDLIVGVNIVGPENGVIALRDYHIHMLFFKYLKSKYPNVKRALHAGELTIGMVRPKNLTFHISEAIDIAEANRIGHGIDIVYEKDSYKLLEKIKQKSAIEINLTSNKFILGVSGQDHPYTIYSKYNVPLVISTDDSGVSRDNLTTEYLLLTSQYKPKYSKLKEYVYNSIKYSFLTEEDKNRLKIDLDKRFVSFEKQMASFFDKLNL